MRDKAKLYLKEAGARLGGSPIRVGYMVTALWLVGLALYISIVKPLWGLDLGELGDFLSGAFAPLAFFWLVIAVLLQTTELGLQREELRQSREALEEQAKETRALVQQNRLSVEVATQTLEQQQQREYETRLHQVIDALAMKIITLADRDTVLVNGNKSKLFGRQERLHYQVEHGNRDGVFRLALKNMMSWTTYAEDQQKPTLIVPELPSLIDDLQLLHGKFQELDTILTVDSNLDRPSGLQTVQMRVYALDLDLLSLALQHVLSLLKQE